MDDGALLGDSRVRDDRRSLMFSRDASTSLFCGPLAFAALMPRHRSVRSLEPEMSSIGGDLNRPRRDSIRCTGLCLCRFMIGLLQKKRASTFSAAPVLGTGRLRSSL